MLSLSAPGKTFLCGEYLALNGGPSLVLATEPRFRLTIAKSLVTSHPFHPESPAGQFIASHPEFYEGFELKFENPYGTGGFGGSTAEFLLVKAMHQFGPGLRTEHQLDLDVRAAWNAYRELHTGRDIKPSGADLVGQACGFVTAFERRSGRIQIFSWPFQNLGFALFKTSIKLATHEHLNDGALLELADQFETLEPPCQKVWDALAKGSEGQFLIGLNEVGRILEKLKLQAEPVLLKTQKLRGIAGIRAAKGCGAMGADVVVVVFDRREIRREEVIDAGKALDLVPVASEIGLAAGFEKDPAVLQKELLL